MRRRRMDKKKVEFIESYIKIGNGDYEWNDNHGELVRCANCKHGTTIIDAMNQKSYILCGNKNDHYSRDPDWYCADGEKEQ
jgi:hypothetical protein